MFFLQFPKTSRMGSIEERIFLQPGLSCRCGYQNAEPNVEENFPG